MSLYRYMPHRCNIDGGNDASTKLLVHPFGNDGSTTIVDSSSTGWTMSAGIVDTDVPGVLSPPTMLFNGSNAIGASGISWGPGSGNFTVDFWAYPNLDNTTSHLAFGAYGATVCVGGQLYRNGSTYYVSMGFTGVTGGGDFADICGSTVVSIVNGKWYHFAFTRGHGGGANTWGIAVDGTYVVTATSTQALDSSVTIYIGEAFIWSGEPPTAATYFFKGNMQEFRFSNVCRWPTDFYPSRRMYG